MLDLSLRNMDSDPTDGFYHPKMVVFLGRLTGILLGYEWNTG